MGQDEAVTLNTLIAYRKVMDSLIGQHPGRFVNSAGDSVPAEFASEVEAVDCAVEIQTALKIRNGALPAERRMRFSHRFNLGGAMVEGEQIYGDGVNVAARRLDWANALDLYRHLSWRITDRDIRRRGRKSLRVDEFLSVR